jgi:hypothetical protein
MTFLRAPRIWILTWSNLSTSTWIKWPWCLRASSRASLHSTSSRYQRPQCYHSKEIMLRRASGHRKVPQTKFKNIIITTWASSSEMAGLAKSRQYSIIYKGSLNSKTTSARCHHRRQSMSQHQHRVSSKLISRLSSLIWSLHRKINLALARPP